MMTENPSMDKLLVPDRGLDASSGCSAHPQCPEMSSNVSVSEISSLTIHRPRK